MLYSKVLLVGSRDKVLFLLCSMFYALYKVLKVILYKWVYKQILSKTRRQGVPIMYIRRC